ncbi:N-acetylglutamate synthase, mitochondrial-like [Glandiceps talaboti]
MQILLSKKASFWHRRMHCLLLCTSTEGSDTGLLRALTSWVGKTLSRNSVITTSPTTGHLNKLLKRDFRTCSVVSNCRVVSALCCKHSECNASSLTQTHSQCHGTQTCSSSVPTARRVLFQHSKGLLGRPESLSKQHCRGLASNRHTPNITHQPPQHSMTRTAQDLKRFLEEFGTDPREARYWLKNFVRTSENWKPFAIVQVDQEVFRHPEMMDSLASSISFLLRHDMKAIVVHGNILPDNAALSNDILQAGRNQLTGETMMMVNKLEEHGAPAYPFFSGGSVLHTRLAEGRLNGKVKDVNVQPLEWCLRSSHVPVISSIGETESGQLVNVDACHAVEEIAKVLTPLKVMFLNTTGGFVDENKQVIANVNLPADFEQLVKQPWCSEFMKYKVGRITKLLNHLPSQSSIVITSADTLLTELFTHRGSGTFFKNTEPIRVYHTLEDVSLDRLLALLTRAFGRMLSRDYFDNLGSRLHTLYLSEGYNACAIITRENGIDVPYLDKFAVSAIAQGEGTSEMLWEFVRRDFKNLFWRSRNTNMINSWYFKRSEGSWSNGNWTVFWYGVSDPKVSYELVDYAASLPSSFVEAPLEDNSTHQPVNKKKKFLFR